MILVFIIALLSQHKQSAGQQYQNELNSRELGDNFLVQKVLAVGACLITCVSYNIAGRCWHIFDCVWPCLSNKPPPTNVKPSNPQSRQTLIRMARPYSSYVRSQETTAVIDIMAYVKLFKCFGKCLETHLPTDPLTFVGFIGCTLGECVCGGGVQRHPRTKDKKTIKGILERYNKNWNQKSFSDLGKNIDGSIEWQSVYGYDAGLSYR